MTDRAFGWKEDRKRSGKQTDRSACNAVRQTDGWLGGVGTDMVCRKKDRKRLEERQKIDRKTDR